MTLPHESKSERLNRIRRPTKDEIAARLASQDREFSYREVGASGSGSASFPTSLAGTYDLDRREFCLGSGRDLFERARESLFAWRQFEIPWLQLHGASVPARPGQVVATLASFAGFWFYNPCRVVYTEFPTGQADSAAFAYGTLQGHVERGEERFQVSFDPRTGEVTYEISAFSRPAILLSKLGYPIVRRLQKRFAESSAVALANAVA